MHLHTSRILFWMHNCKQIRPGMRRSSVNGHGVTAFTYLPKEPVVESRELAGQLVPRVEVDHR